MTLIETHHRRAVGDTPMCFIFVRTAIPMILSIQLPMRKVMSVENGCENVVVSKRFHSFVDTYRVKLNPVPLKGEKF